ncbi:AAA family ATPase [Altererythrobacter sp. GH1-8]|uniref:AAA family ATPase n=1 Tax=Altererythrobacter sp. GH1-8 TaxID=3349333 RepID=UPI00374D29D1
MLILRALELNNFGPFKGNQRVEFPTEEGVSVVYGENMRGKTSLLNAIRFAFFGKIIGRGRSETSLSKVGNWEAKEDGEHAFSVRLDLKHDAVDYTLVRKVQPKLGIDAPEIDAHFEVGLHLSKGGHQMGPDEAKVELNRILPEEVSRFFLFDGELLQEYEELLIEDSDMGTQISDAIEKILGLPVLTNSIASLNAAQKKASSAYSKAATADSQTREIGHHLSQLAETKEEQAAGLQRYKEKLEEARREKTDAEMAVRKFDRASSILDQVEADTKEIASLQEELDLGLIAIQDSMTNAWCVLLQDRLKKELEHLRGEQEALRAKAIRLDILNNLSAEGKDQCPACFQEISSTAKEKIKEASETGNQESGDAVERQVSGLGRQIDAISGIVEKANADALTLRWNAIEDLRVKIEIKKGEVREKKALLEGYTEHDLRAAKLNYDKTVRKIDKCEESIKQQEEALKLTEERITSLRDKLDRVEGGRLDVERRRLKLLDALLGLFEEGKTAFKNDLKSRVESDASRHFRSLTSEPEYSGLQINEGYGLTIVHKTGATIPVRSAGAEHVVALALVAALQGNAPMRGPIIIDSPFGRLDKTHTNNIVSALPSMSPQVILLVYEDELAPSLARELLEIRLKREWKLQRISARHTQINPREN